MKKIFFFITIFNFLFLLYGEEITIKTVELSDGTHRYYHDLITSALESNGYKVKLDVERSLPQTRIVEYLDSGKLTLHWLVQNSERDSKYIPIEVGITNGLIGNRILFIPKGAQAIYDKVKTLDDFKKLDKIGGFGKNWFDIKVWEANNLKVFVKDGEWRDIYKMIEAGNRGVDYFSRGAHEIVIEQSQYPYLDVEKKLVLIYKRDFRFYLNKESSSLKPVLLESLQKAAKNGLINKLIRKYFSDVFDKDKINLDSRIKINLVTPE
ncbi:MAG TPA: hypothetical protein PK771_14655 [Spirochaetota bacterium]|nr:hypothetical protein [Spirochaetota bacterium]